MSWSTGEIDELAGASLRAVRYHHEVERPTGLGFSLSPTAELGEAGAELAATVERPGASPSSWG